MNRRLATYLGLWLLAIPVVVAVAAFIYIFSSDRQWLVSNVPLELTTSDKERSIGLWSTDEIRAPHECLAVTVVATDASSSQASLEPVQDVSDGRGGVMPGFGQVVVPAGAMLRVLHSPTPDCHHGILVETVQRYEFPFGIPARVVAWLIVGTLAGAVILGETIIRAASIVFPARSTM